MVQYEACALWSWVDLGVNFSPLTFICVNFSISLKNVKPQVLKQASHFDYTYPKRRGFSETSGAYKINNDSFPFTFWPGDFSIILTFITTLISFTELHVQN